MRVDVIVEDKPEGGIPRPETAQKHRPGARPNDEEADRRRAKKADADNPGQHPKPAQPIGRSGPEPHDEPPRFLVAEGAGKILEEIIADGRQNDQRKPHAEPSGTRDPLKTTAPESQEKPGRDEKEERHRLDERGGGAGQDGPKEADASRTLVVPDERQPARACRGRPSADPAGSSGRP